MQKLVQKQESQRVSTSEFLLLILFAEISCLGVAFVRDYVMPLQATFRNIFNENSF